METLSTTSTAFNPGIQKVLTSFHSVAQSTLNGPSAIHVRLPTAMDYGFPAPALGKRARYDYDECVATSAAATPFAIPAAMHPPVTVHPIPVFTPIDSTCGTMSETVLESYNIACFVVGGEKRLCLPQVISTVLAAYSLPEINFAIERLHIYFSRCTPQQLHYLKAAEVLPKSATACGLVTQTNAERLCFELLHTDDDEEKFVITENSFMIYHECFGRCRGVLTPEIFASAENSRSIQCDECGKTFRPNHFVLHAHQGREVATCHWGFDSRNWRSYLHVEEDVVKECQVPKLEQMLNDVKEKKFAGDSSLSPKVGLKRPYPAAAPAPFCWGYPATAFAPLDRYPVAAAAGFWPAAAFEQMKKGKEDNGADMMAAAAAGGYGYPLPPYLATGAPILLNPEKVVPPTVAKHSISLDKLIPNVALAPPLKRAGTAETGRQGAAAGTESTEVLVERPAAEKAEEKETSDNPTEEPQQRPAAQAKSEVERLQASLDCVKGINSVLEAKLRQVLTDQEVDSLIDSAAAAAAAVPRDEENIQVD